MRQVIRAMSAALMVALLGAAAWAYQDQPTQSLGDVAKQKSAKKAKKVYTEDDLPTAAGGVSVVGEASAPAAASSGASGTPGAAPGKDGKPGATPAAPDSEKAKEAKDRAETLAKDLVLYEERHKRFKARMDAETDPARKEQMQRDLETMERNMGRVREQQAEAAAAAAGAPAQPKPAEPAQEPPKQ